MSINMQFPLVSIIDMYLLNDLADDREENIIALETYVAMEFRAILLIRN